MPKTMPKNPRLPVPEFVVADLPEMGLCAYAWKCEKHGIQIFSETKAEAPKKWLASYMAEYFPV